MDTIQVARGEAAVFTVTLTSDSGAALPFAGSEALTVQHWKGDDLASVSGATAAWLTAPSLVDVTYPAAFTAQLDVGAYYARLWIDTTTLAAEWLVRVTPAAGSGTAPSVYCTYDDVLTYCPWIMQAQTADPTIQADLGEHRARARTKLEDVILARFRPSSVWWLQAISHSDHDDPSTWLRAQLDANRLMTTGSRGAKVKEITARWTAVLVLENQVGLDDALLKQAAYQRATIHQLLASYVAELDTDGDGEVDLRVPCGILSTR